MNGPLRPNDLLLLGSDVATAPPVRVLYIDPGSDAVWYFDCREGAHLPVQDSLRQIERRRREKAAFVTKLDDYLVYPADPAKLTPKQMEIRDRNWGLIEPLVEDGGLALMHREHRHRLIKERIAECGSVRRHTMFEILRRYWRGGQIRDALIPPLRNCGGPGKGKTRGTAWLGRTPNGRNRDDLEPIDRERLDQVVTAFLTLVTQRLRVLKAYDGAIRAVFGERMIARGREGLVVPSDRKGIPTFGTVRYHARKRMTREEEIAVRVSKDTFNKQHREILGKSADKVFRPGQVFQIDATPWPARVRSSIDPSVTIGTATVYFVVDAYSQVIVGFHVTLDAERAMGARLAFANAFSDKDEYLESLGLEPRDGGFPSAHGCAGFVTDRGAAFTADEVADSAGLLKADITYTPRRRPDMKGEVENAFRRAQHGLRRRHEDKEAFGKTEPVHDEHGVFTLRELERQIAVAVMQVNATTTIKAVPEGYLSADGTLPTAMELHRYGEAHLKTPPGYHPDVVKFALWPRGVLRWNGKDLTLLEHGLHYRVEAGSSISMVRKAGSQERRYDCIYHPSDMSEVFILHGGKVGETATLVGTTSATPHRSLGDILALRERTSLRQPAKNARIAHERSKYDLEQEALRAEALEAAGGVIATPAKGVSQTLRQIEQAMPLVGSSPRFVEATRVEPPRIEGPSEGQTSMGSELAPSAMTPAEALRARQLQQRELARSIGRKGGKS